MQTNQTYKNAKWNKIQTYRNPMIYDAMEETVGCKRTEAYVINEVSKV